MKNKISILANTLEQMLADAEDNGRDGIQPKLTSNDVEIILKALNNYYFHSGVDVDAAPETCISVTDIYKTDCKECIHAPICEYCADHLEGFSLPRKAESCAMYESGNLDDVEVDRVCEVRTRTSPFVDTIEGMLSDDYKDRFVAEYMQTKLRYERLKAFNTKIEAAHAVCDRDRVEGALPSVQMPNHDCPDYMLREQQEVMGRYLHILEVRAVIEGVDLGGI